MKCPRCKGNGLYDASTESHVRLYICRLCGHHIETVTPTKPIPPKTEPVDKAERSKKIKEGLKIRRQVNEKQKKDSIKNKGDN